MKEGLTVYLFPARDKAGEGASIWMSQEIPAEKPEQKSIEDQLSELVRVPDPDWPDLGRKVTQALVRSFRQDGVAALTPLLTLLQNENADTRFRAAYVLGHTLHYARTLGESDFPERYHAWVAVVQRRPAKQPIPDAVLHELVGGLRSKSAAAQVWAAGGLAYIARADNRAVSLLIHSLRDRDPQVRGWSAVIVPDDEGSLSILVDVVCDPQLNSTLRQNALSNLEKAATASDKDRATTLRSRLRDVVQDSIKAAIYPAIAMGILAPADGRTALPVLLAALDITELGSLHQRVAEAVVRIDPTLAAEPRVALALDDDDLSEGYW